MYNYNQSAQNFHQIRRICDKLPCKNQSNYTKRHIFLKLIFSIAYNDDRIVENDMSAVFVEVLDLYAKNVEETREVTIEIPEEMVTEFHNTFSNKNVENGNYVYVGTRRFKTLKQPNQIREALMKGYVEMSQINLLISSECLHAEYEAEDTVERLVSGG